ncbi:MAG: DNA/RNA non-specific endonuclease [Phaeodactylibacter sp.]|nr:DNA/RNA non-specific endonuclease [Phaeodactylibacter sp.]MCB9049069.1 DNA/RNA non-specific endonuclease [Lewinellaceae bacterium]
MMKTILTALLLSIVLAASAQQLDADIDALNQQLAELARQRQQLGGQLEELKLQRIQRDLKAIGLPSEDYILHSAMALEYAEEHEQARWVAHIILPDIITGSVGRTNDFRPDPLVATGSAVEADYFLKYLKPDSTYDYDGFGYDRGHLAPSADFRWSERALSESYFYSNMSPQIDVFNREGWAELESLIRGYVFRNPGSQLFVVTGPILREGLPVIERGVNKVSIPEYFYKVVLDREKGTGIGFIIPHRQINAPLETFAVSIDEVEQRTGLDFFNLLPEPEEAALESRLEKSAWIPELAGGDVEPLYAPSLPPNHFNTVQAKLYMGKGEEITVCGTVVGTRRSRSGNAWLNLDKQFPNQIFSVFVRKEDLPNFSYNPDEYLLNKKVCFTGKVENFSGTPTMNVEVEEAVGLELVEK